MKFQVISLVSVVSMAIPSYSIMGTYYLLFVPVLIIEWVLILCGVHYIIVGQGIIVIPSEARLETRHIEFHGRWAMADTSGM